MVGIVLLRTVIETDKHFTRIGTDQERRPTQRDQIVGVGVSPGSAIGEFVDFL